jgi:hypothetical protein
MEEIINKIFKEKYPNGLSAEYTKEEIIVYMMAINDVKEQLSIDDVSKRTFRKATPEDIVVGNTVYLLGDGNEIYTQTIEEVLRPDDQWKAYVADDGCRYGLDGLYVY